MTPRWTLPSSMPWIARVADPRHSCADAPLVPTPAPGPSMDDCPKSAQGLSSVRPRLTDPILQLASGARAGPARDLFATGTPAMGATQGAVTALREAHASTVKAPRQNHRQSHVASSPQATSRRVRQGSVERAGASRWAETSLLAAAAAPAFGLLVGAFQPLRTGPRLCYTSSREVHKRLSVTARKMP